MVCSFGRSIALCRPQERPERPVHELRRAASERYREHDAAPAAPAEKPREEVDAGVAPAQGWRGERDVERLEPRVDLGGDLHVGTDVGVLLHHGHKLGVATQLQQPRVVGELLADAHVGFVECVHAPDQEREQPQRAEPQHHGAQNVRECSGGRAHLLGGAQSR